MVHKDTGSMFGSIITAVSLRRCFYLSAMVVVLSTLMAVVIIVKLSPLESVKCQPHAVTPAIEWSTVANQRSEFPTPQTNPNQKEINDRKYQEMREKNIQNKVARLSQKMRNKILPLLGNNTTLELNYNVHIFYYAWYRSQSYDGFWKHWNHDYLPNWKKNDKRVFPDGSHQPPADIGANYYPSLGCYSSMDPQV